MAAGNNTGTGTGDADAEWSLRGVHAKYGEYDSSGDFDFTGMNEAQAVVTYFEQEIEHYKTQASRSAHAGKG